ncbi:MAG: glycine C-acetyltransferase [Gammaproteobacteria bacterium]|nr:glycine C-acetyltransferase [Gammaproteobacteria bacterium]
MNSFKEKFTNELKNIKDKGLYKNERLITSQQSAEIIVGSNKKVLNFCANNYLGLSNDSRIIKAAQDGINKYGFGLSSVRFICGTQNIHRELEQKVAQFLGKDDTILYSSCFDANGGLFETLLDKNDAIISDQLNHASIIDGVRLCKAHRYRYQNSNMDELENILKETQHHKNRLITTDGVFSMDGYIAKLDKICSLAKQYNALIHVDDSHATGFVGPTGKGSAEYHNVLEKIDIITSTFGKALGGAAGGFTSSSQEIVDILRQRSRPYLFSNSLAPAVVCASMKAFDILETSTDLLDKLNKNTKYFRESLSMLGFTIKEGIHPIVPIMFGDAKLAQNISRDMLELGIYVIGFSFPVVPKDEARIRVQISASHSKSHLDKALEAFSICGEKYNLI